MPTRKQLMRIISIQTEIAKLGLDLGGVMQYVVEQTLPLIAADGAVIELAEAGDMVYRAAAGIAKQQLGLRLSADASLSGLSVKGGAILYCADSEMDDRVDRIACQKVGLRSMIVVPLKHREVTVGVLKAMSVHTDNFKQRDIELLGMLSEIVAATMYLSVTFDSDSLYIKATHDGMTGLANRALFMDRLRNIIAHTKRAHCPAGVLMIDIDGLKAINDNYGHRVGNAVIMEFARRFKLASRESDTVARLGGDEFGIILDSLETPDGMAAAVKRVESELAQPFVFENQRFPLIASIGAALIPVDGVEPEDILDVADQRMYTVKRAHKAGRR